MQTMSSALSALGLCVREALPFSEEMEGKAKDEPRRGRGRALEEIRSD